MIEHPKFMKCTVRAKAGKVDGGSGSCARAVKAPVSLDNKFLDEGRDDSTYLAGRYQF
jgi:hypothetical protein